MGHKTRQPTPRRNHEDDPGNGEIKAEFGRVPRKRVGSVWEDTF